MRGLPDPSLRPYPKFEVGDQVIYYGERHEVEHINNTHIYCKLPYSYDLKVLAKPGYCRCGVPEFNLELAPLQQKKLI
jgi:hypothetical protein